MRATKRRQPMMIPIMAATDRVLTPVLVPGTSRSSENKDHAEAWGEGSINKSYYSEYTVST